MLFCIVTCVICMRVPRTMMEEFQKERQKEKGPFAQDTVRRFFPDHERSKPAPDEIA